MGTSLFYSYYPKECNNNAVIPYLNYPYERYVNGKLPIEFYELCRKYGDYNSDGYCYVFTDKIKLFEFCSKQVVPERISEYVTYPSKFSYNNFEKFKDDDIFIIWIR